MSKATALGQTPPLGLLAGYRKIGGRGVHIQRRAEAGRHEYMLNRPDPAPDVKQRHPLKAFGRQRLDQEAGRLRRAMPVVLCEFPSHPLDVKAALHCFTVTVGHLPPSFLYRCRYEMHSCPSLLGKRVESNSTRLSPR